MLNHKISVKAQPGLLGGAALLAFTAISWGGLLQVAKPMLIVLDPFWLNTIRYVLSVPAFAAVLFLREGKAGFRFEGRLLRLMLFGTVGFAGFGIVTLLGVRGTRPEHAALIVATMPLVTAAVGWARGAGRPPAFTLACMLTALVGVGLTASQGNPSSILERGGGGASLLVFVGVVCWAVYTQSAAALPSWSSLRYTTLSCGASLPGFAVLLAGASAAKWAHLPDTSSWANSTSLGMGYIVVVATIAAMLSWNTGIRRLGPLNGVLFINLVPVSAFAIGVSRGERFSAIEWGGAGMVLVTLIASNIHARRGAVHH